MPSLIRYEFADDKVITIKNKHKSDPQVIGEELARIKAAHKDGDLKPEIIVREARIPRNPLHQNFEWDDTAAAHAHRLQQARALTHCLISYPIAEPEKVSPAFISITDTRGTAYKSAEDVMDSKRLQDIVLRQAERDLLAFQTRYRRFQELFEALKGPLGTIRKLRGGAEE